MLDPNAKRPDGKFVYSSIKRRELMQQNEKIIAKRNAKALQELDAIIPLVNQLGAPGHAIIAKYQKYEPAFHRLHCIKVAIAAIKREVQDQTKYKEQPVDIETFVTGSEYLNMKIKQHMDAPGDIYPEVLEELKKACSRPYLEHVYTGSIGCVDADTEFLSEKGWVRIADWSGQRIAQWNPKTTRAEFIETEYVKKRCTKLYWLKTKYGVNQMLSPEHTVPYLDKAYNLKVTTAQDVYDKHRDNANGFGGRFITTFKAAHRRGVDLTDAQIRVQVAVCADSHITPGRKSCTINVKRQRKKDRIRELLRDAGIPWKEHRAPEGYERFYFKPPVLTKKLNFWDMTPEQLAVVCDEVFLWDGSIDDLKFRTQCPETRDFVQYALTTVGGYRVSVRTDAREDRNLPCFDLICCGAINPTMQAPPHCKTPIQVVSTTDGYKYCFVTESGYWVSRRGGNIVVTGNSAKTTSSLILFCYHLYILSCLRDPHREYSLLKSDEIVMVFQSLNASHAKTVNYGRFKAMVSACKYFQKNFMYDKSVDSEMRFPNRIIVKPISGSSTAAIGSNSISFLIDEINFMKVTEKSKHTAEGGSYDQARENYSAAVRRRESRFMKKGKTAGCLLLVSSKRYPGEFTDIKIKEAETNPNIFIYDKRIWDISPPGRYTGETFKLFTGDATRRPRILEPHDVLRGDDEKLVMNVPIEYKRSFENDPLGSLRDIAGVSTMALQPYIMDVEAVDRMFDKERESILDLDEVEFTTEEIHFIAENLKHPAEPRAVHIDLAMTTDSAGLVCGYVAGFTKMERDEGEYETLPVICLDFILRIVPPKNGEIPFHRIRALIHKLKTLGVNIQWVSADLFQAVDTLQLLARKGFKVGVQSMDKTVIPYDITKDAIMDGRVHAPVHETARMEIISLERDLKKNKIDHGNVYGKDCSDALTGVVYLLTTRREIWVKHKIPLVHIPSSIVSKTNKNSNSIDKRKPTQQAEEDEDE